MGSSIEHAFLYCFSARRNVNQNLSLPCDGKIFSLWVNSAQLQPGLKLPCKQVPGMET